MNPLRRRSDLIIHPLSDETLAYDERNDRAHRLNPAAALVWEHCDGHTSIEEIGAVLTRELGFASGSDVVELALRKLNKAGLLESSSYDAPSKGVTRREVARRLGLAGGAALALPLVISILTPTPLLAASCAPRGGVCEEGQGQGTPCCRGLQCNNNRCR